MGDNRVHYVSAQTSGGLGLTACSIERYVSSTDRVANVTCVLCLRSLLQHKDARDKRIARYDRKAVVANKEAEALRRKLADANVRLAILEGFMENSKSQVGYKVRYEKLRAKLSLIRQLANPEVNGIPYDEPQLPLPTVGGFAPMEPKDRDPITFKVERH